MRVAGQEGSEDGIKVCQRAAATAAKSVLAGIQPVVHSDEGSDTESIVDTDPQPEPSKSSKKTMSTRASTKDKGPVKKSK
jgi:hypothetical protein